MPVQITRHLSFVTLVLIPLVIVLIWILENYLLATTIHIFQRVNLPGLVLYTALSSILVGMLVPLIRIRAAFLSGAVNMFQIGFRSARRTLIAIVITALACYSLVVITGLPLALSDQARVAMLFFLLLPTGSASVMICWVMAGTHIQAYVRSSGVAVSVIAGVLITALLFALSLSILVTGPDLPGTFTGLFVTGCVSALFFFAVRDVYATILVVTSGLLVLTGKGVDPAYLSLSSPVVVLCGLAAVVVLAGIHVHFSRHYTTIRIPEP